MSELSSALSKLRGGETGAKIEIATVSKLSPFAIKIDSHEYDAVNFTIYAPLPKKLVEKRAIDVQQTGSSPIIGRSRYQEYDLVEEFDRSKTEPYEVGDLVAVVDKGNTFIVLGALCDMKGGVKK